jgi:hypothetical protein
MMERDKNQKPAPQTIQKESAEEKRMTKASDSTPKTAPKGDGRELQSQSMPEELESELKDAGYSDVRVIPRSYVVSAKDPDENQIIMLIGPYSFETVTFYKSPSLQR